MTPQRQFFLWFDQLEVFLIGLGHLLVTTTVHQFQNIENEGHPKKQWEIVLVNRPCLPVSIGHHNRISSQLDQPLDSQCLININTPKTQIS